MAWQVQLNGHLFDLENLYRYFQMPEVSIVKYQDRYYLESLAFHDNDNPTIIRKLAIRIIENINGVAKFRIGGFVPVEIGDVIKIDDEGHRNKVVFFSGGSALRFDLHINGLNLKTEESDKLTDQLSLNQFELVYKLSQQDKDVSEALKIYGNEEHTWSNLFKIYEIVRNDLGDSVNNFSSVSKKNIKRFRSTCQDPRIVGREARHARLNTEAPTNPMKLSEAEQLISTLLNKWIDSKLHNDK